MQEKYFNVGLNQFCLSYPDVDLIAVFDEHAFFGIEQDYRGQMILTNSHNKYCLTDRAWDNYELFNPYMQKEPLEYNKYNALAFTGLTHSIVLNWAYINGFKTVVLCGVDLDLSDKRHFDNEQLFNPSGMCIYWSIEQIEKYYQNKMQIVTLNQDSILNIDRVGVGELLQ